MQEPLERDLAAMRDCPGRKTLAQLTSVNALGPCGPHPTELAAAACGGADTMAYDLIKTCPFARWTQQDPPGLEYAIDRLTPCAVISHEYGALGWKCSLACIVKRCEFTTYRHSREEAFGQTVSWLERVHCPGNIRSRPSAQLGRPLPN